MAEKSNALKIEYLRVDDIHPYQRELRKHPKEQREKAEKLIGHYGQVKPAVIGPDNILIDGHLIWSTMKKMGYDEIAVVRCRSHDEQDVQALRYALNRLPLDSKWNRPEIAIEFQSLFECDFNMEFTGFDQVEIEAALNIGEAPPDPEEIPFNNLVTDFPTVTREGDLWVLGEHKLLNGNALEKSDMAKLMESDRAQLVNADPPYNLPSSYIGGNGSVQHDDFAMAAGEMSEEEFIQFLITAFLIGAEFSVDGSLHAFFMDGRHTFEILSAGREAFDEYKAQCIWSKNNGGMGSLYRQSHEVVHFFKKGRARHVNNVLLGKHGRNRRTVWEYPGVNTFRKGRMEELSAHPTPKPTELVKDLLLDVSNKGDVVLDYFSGGGTMLIAAERTGRKARCMELSPQYCDVSICRWQKETGQDAIYADSGRTFNDLEAEVLGAGSLPAITDATSQNEEGRS